MKDYQKIANQIMTLVGGKDNVKEFTHCQTRLRFVLNDNTIPHIEEIKKIEGVLGVVNGAQFQVIVGNEVGNIFDKISTMLNESNGSQNKPSESIEKNEKKSAMILDFIVSVFQPLIPAIAGAGMIKAILTLLVMSGVITNTSAAYKVFYNAADAAIFFMPLMIAITAATKLKCNKLVALTIAGAMILPNMTALLAEGADLFGIKIQAIGYNGQVFPVILMVLVLYFIEKYSSKICPKAIQVFMVPLICYIVVVPLTFLVLGPIGYNVGTLFVNLLVFIYSKIGFLAVALLSASLPFMIITGMHKPLVPYIVAAVSAMGYEIMYATASLAHNIAESGASFAVAIRTKNTKLRGVALSAGVSSLFGITEPAVYGITIQRKRVLACVSGSAAVAGAFFGIMAVKCFTIANPGLASMAIYIDPNNAMNIVWAFSGFGIALVLSFISTLIIYKDEIDIEVKEGEF